MSLLLRLKPFLSYAQRLVKWSSGLFAYYYSWWFNIPTVPLISIVSETEKYNKRYVARFQKSFEVKDAKWNSNIDPCFFDKKALAEVLVPEKNALEVQWRRRLLFENTPRGNLIMYYDPYKLGFAYYSDASSLPYSTLNSAAIKYCLHFGCRDLFLDDEITPNGSPSPLISVHITEKPAQPEPTKGKITADKNVFARFKNYGGGVSNTDKTTTGKEATTSAAPAPTRVYTRNRFICQGKIANMQFLQPIPKEKNRINGFTSKLLDNLRGETTLQKQVMNYQDFKRKSMT